LSLNLIQTLALGAVVFWAGVLLKRAIPVLGRLNIPSAVIGGLLFALFTLLVRDRYFNLTLDTAAQPLFMVAFFTSIGMGAGISLLKKGGIQVLLFLAVSTLFCFVQNFAGMWIAGLFHLHPLAGVVAGSVTLVGGPATGMAFAPLFEEAGVRGAGTLAIAAATFGILCGGILGGPAGTWLIKRLHRKQHHTKKESPAVGENDRLVIEPQREDSPFLVSLLAMAIAMGIGSVISGWIQGAGVTLPAYIGAMLVAAVIRNIHDTTGWFRLDETAMEFVGGLSLNIFLVIALMNLRLWEIVSLAIPLTVILAVQVVLVVLFSVTALFWLMGRDYEAAVMSGGFIGFVLGTTANAMANMRTLEGRFGPAPRAFLVVPIVGAFFIDFTNALIINLFLLWFR
jgi:glutamate:Na+ symporter, ESS family